MRILRQFPTNYVLGPIERQQLQVRRQVLEKVLSPPRSATNSHLSPLRSLVFSSLFQVSQHFSKSSLSSFGNSIQQHDLDEIPKIYRDAQHGTSGFPSDQQSCRWHYEWNHIESNCALIPSNRNPRSFQISRCLDRRSHTQ